MLKASTVACILAVVLSAQEGFSPARYRAGDVPALPVMALGGGQVFLELAVGPEGHVTAVRPLRTTPPFTELVVDAVSDWQFLPAEDDVRPERAWAGEPQSRMSVASTVLVAAVFRPPALYARTLGEAPRDVASASDETALPLTTTMPPFPPLAYSSGVVLLEARVDRDGAVADATVIRSAPPFDGAAQAALRQWSFRPAHVRGRAVSTYAYILFGFPVPVIVPTVPHRPPCDSTAPCSVVAPSILEGRRALQGRAAEADATARLIPARRTDRFGFRAACWNGG